MWLAGSATAATQEPEEVQDTHTHTLPRPASLQQGGRSSADGREVGLVRSIASTTGSGAVPFSWSHAHADADAASSSPCRRQRQQFRGHGFFSQIFSS